MEHKKAYRIVRMLQIVCKLNIAAVMIVLALSILSAEPSIQQAAIVWLCYFDFLLFGWLHDKFAIAQRNIVTGRWKGC